MAENEEQGNPILKALPPATDYLTYLTILEYNLDEEQLPLLHELLQDTTLTANIGWDLVKILLPLLPASEPCLKDVAFLGNPRETVLKVAELLEELGQRELGSELDEDERSDAGSASELAKNEAGTNSTLLATQFETLLHMLCIIHPRIRTKYPSRFLGTSLRAVIKAYGALAHVPSSIRPILMLVKSMSGSKRPNLPPRKSQSAVPIVSSGDAAPDPEGQIDAPADGEAALKQHILISFITHVAEAYVQSLPPLEETSQLAWSSRFFEKRYPEKVLLIRETYRDRFQRNTDLEMREATFGQILNAADGDLGIPWDDLLWLVSEPPGEALDSESTLLVQQMPLSRTGALHCLAAKAATALIFDRPFPFHLSLFPQHEKLVSQFLDLQDSSDDFASTTDAIIILGWVALESTGGIAEAETRSEFSSYLHRISFVSANMPLADLRYQAHFFTSAVLHANPSPDARLDFINDTLEHCPYGNIRVCAVGWLKDEILTAFGLVSQSSQNKGLQITGVTEDSLNPFAQPSSTRACAPWLFEKPEIDVSERELAVKLPFWLAALNLYYLLCSSDVLSKALDIPSVSVEFKIREDFIGALEKLVKSPNVKDSDSSQALATSREGFEAEIWAVEDALTRLGRLESTE